MKYCLALLAGIIPFFAQGQLAEVDSLQTVLLETPQPAPRSDVLNKLSFIYSRISLVQAEEYAKKALSLSAPGYPRGIAEAYSNLGICASIRGKYSEGLDYFFKSLKLRDDAGDSRAAAKSLNNIAGVYLYQHDFDKAIEYSERSLAILRTENDSPAVASALVSLATINTDKKDTASALSFYFQALDEFGRNGDNLNEVRTMIKIGLLERDTEKEKILGACFKAMDKINPNTEFLIAIDMYKTIAEIYADINKHDAAYSYYHRALTLADRHFDNQEAIRVRLALSELFQADQRYDSALFYYRAYAALNEKTYSAEKTSQLVILEKVYETEKKDKQLASSRAEIQSLGLIIGAISIMLLLLVISAVILFRYYRQKRAANVQLQNLVSAVSTQARELQVANAEIQRINEHLEEEVSMRTQKIKIQNEKLMDYVYFNSHEVRGPVARLLGLADLMEKNPSVEEILDISRRIQLAVGELDQTIRELNKKLETE